MNCAENRFKITFLFFILFTSIGYAQYPAPLVRSNSFNPTTEEFEIRWEPSAAPNVAYYQVWYYYPQRGNISGGWLQVKGNIPATSDLYLSYAPDLLRKANPLQEPVVVGVQAFDATDQSLNYLIVEEFDSTMYLEAEYDTCQALLNLKWNQYQYKQWPQPGLNEYQVFVSEDNGQNYFLLTSIPNSQTEVDLSTLDANKNYTVYISAISENTPGDIANSITAQFSTFMALIPEYMTADYGTFNDNNIALSFSIDPQSETSEYNLYRANNPGGPFNLIETFNTSDKTIAYTDNSNYYSGPYYYKLKVKNNCGLEIRETENMASTVLLTQTGAELEPVLNWNSYQNWQPGNPDYSVQRKFDNTDYQTITSVSDTSYTDNELADLANNNYSTEVCYRIIAEESGGAAQSYSNPVCRDLPPNIRFEFDAFTPGSGSGNDTFGPTIDFLPDEYHFEILNRSGRKVYDSTDPENTRWDGYINGKLAPEGAYMCIIQYRIGNSKKQTISSAVAVVYQ